MCDPDWAFMDRSEIGMKLRFPEASAAVSEIIMMFGICDEGKKIAWGAVPILEKHMRRRMKSPVDGTPVDMDVR